MIVHFKESMVMSKIHGYRAILGTFGVFLAVFVMLDTSAEASDTSSTSEMKNVKAYGNCTVSDSVDMFTDKVSHLLLCKESTIMDKTEVGFYSDVSKGLIVVLSKGVQMIIEDKVDIAIRVDKGKLRKGSWYQSGGQAINSDAALANSLLAEVARGKRVVIKVGDEGGNVLLDGSAAAVADFKKRVSKQMAQRKQPSKTQKISNSKVK